MGYVSSAHELACRWGASQDLSVDSTRLPHYVEAMSDTLRLAADAAAYTVRLTPTAEGPIHILNTIYLVASVGDSLYYRDLIDEDPRDRSASNTVSIRALRPIDVPGSKSQYTWVETKKVWTIPTDSLTRSVEEWHGHVLTYDRKRGMRYLDNAPVRREVRHNGELYGARQLDITIPEPGVMIVDERLRRGKEVTKGFGWRHWMGRHVIDTTATEEHEPKWN